MEEPRILLHARLIRDADKLDNCRVKLEDPLETFAGGSAEEIGAQKISPKVRADIPGREIHPLLRPGDADGFLGILPGLLL